MISYVVLYVIIFFLIGFFSHIIWQSFDESGFMHRMSAQVRRSFDDTKDKKIDFSKNYFIPTNYHMEEFERISKLYNTRLIYQGERTCFEINTGYHYLCINNEIYKSNVKVFFSISNYMPGARSPMEDPWIDYRTSGIRGKSKENYMIIDIELDHMIKDCDNFLFGNIMFHENHIISISEYHESSFEEKIKNIQETISFTINTFNNSCEDFKNYSKAISEIDSDFDLVKSTLIEIEDLSNGFNYSNNIDHFTFLFEFDDFIKDNPKDMDFITMGNNSLELFKAISNFNSSLHLLGKDYKNFLKFGNKSIQITLYHGIELYNGYPRFLGSPEDRSRYLRYVQDQLKIKF